MKKVVYYTMGDMLPTDVGNKKAMFEYFRYLVSRKDIHLILVIIGNVPKTHQDVYRNMGAELRLIPRHARWSFFEVLNKIGSRLGFDMLWTYFSGLGYRKEFRKVCADADIILMTYACWFVLLPSRTLKSRTIVLTLDIFFYRRSSIGGERWWWQRMNVEINRRFEVAILKRFRKVAVLADYEKDILVKCGMHSEDIIKIGVPISIPELSQPPLAFTERPYNFVLVASSGNVNQQILRCFVERVCPLLPGCHLKVALAGGISKTADTSGAPDNVEFIRLGYLDDLESLFSKSCIGIGTVLCGSGIKVKVVEMVMHNLPVVVTSKGAEGIPLEGDGFVNIDTASEKEVCAVLRRWIEHPEIAQWQGAETGRHVADAFSADKILSDFVQEILR